MKSSDCRCLNLIGQKFNKLTVIARDEDYILPNGRHITKWLCNCDCGTKNVSILGTRLKHGYTKSCGCLNKEVSYKNLIPNNSNNRKYNKYDLTSYEYGVGWTSNTNEEFYFDLEDYDKIKDYCWYKDTGGYICTIRNQKCIKFHRIIMQDYLKDDFVVDHINTLCKEDNRKSNLRVVTKEQNAINRKKNINNTSGKTGVSYKKEINKWQANINYQNKRYYLGVYDNLEDAIQARIEAEIKYFGAYRNTNEYNGDNK